MSIIRSDNRQERHPKPTQDFERKFTNPGFVDWADVAELEAAYTLEYRKNKYFWIDGQYFECEDDGVTYRLISGGGGGGIVTADNGLTINPATNVQLGGDLIQDTEIDLQSHVVDLPNVNTWNWNNGSLQNLVSVSDYFGQGRVQVTDPANNLNASYTPTQVDVFNPNAAPYYSVVYPTNQINPTFFLPLTVNGTAADDAGNIVIGGTGTGNCNVIAFTPVADASSIIVPGLTGTFMAAIANVQAYTSQQVIQTGTTLDFALVGGVLAGIVIIIFYV